MTAAELIERLGREDPDRRVVIQDRQGSRWNPEVWVSPSGTVVIGATNLGAPA